MISLTSMSNESVLLGIPFQWQRCACGQLRSEKVEPQAVLQEIFPAPDGCEVFLTKTLSDRTLAPKGPETKTTEPTGRRKKNVG
jgi:hypothetical protein